MKEITLLAAVDRQWGIGYKNQLLFHLSRDMEMFRKKTIHQIVIMGRKTFESLPGGKPLQDRENIVLSRKKDWQNVYEKPGHCFRVFHSVREAVDYVNDDTRDVFVIGGAEIYKQFLPFASAACITKINAQRQADCFFPDLERYQNWVRISESGIQKDQSGVVFRFVEYKQVGDPVGFTEGCP